MLKGIPLRAIATVIAGPFPSATTVEVVSTTMYDDHREGSMCWVSDEGAANCRVGHGFPLEPGTKVEVELASGQELYAITQSIARLGVSVKGTRW